MRKNLAPLKAKLKKKREENFELRSLVRSLSKKVKVKSEENLSLFKRMQKFEEKKEVVAHALPITEANLNRTKAELVQTKIYVDHLYSLERKARLYPLKKKKNISRSNGNYHASKKGENEKAHTLQKNRLVATNVLVGRQ